MIGDKLTFEPVASKIDVARFFPSMIIHEVPARVFSIKKGRLVVGLFIVFQDFNTGRHWAHMDIKDQARGRAAYEYCKKSMEIIADEGCRELYVIRDSDEPTSERFLSKLGFTNTGEIEEGVGEVWKWHKSLQ
jgi:hypothetical protein